MVDARGKGAEWAFYQELGRRIGPREPVLLVYDAPNRAEKWDKVSYPTPWGDIPSDLAVRLFYLGDRPVRWTFGRADKITLPNDLTTIVIARPRDEARLARLGRSERILAGPRKRPDRVFVAYRITPDKHSSSPIPRIAGEVTDGHAR